MSIANADYVFSSNHLMTETKVTLLSGTQYRVSFRALSASPTLKSMLTNGPWAEIWLEVVPVTRNLSEEPSLFFSMLISSGVFVHNLRLKAGSQISSWMSSLPLVKCVCFVDEGPSTGHTKTLHHTTLRTHAAPDTNKLREDIYSSEEWLFSSASLISCCFCDV